jgi:cytoskeletal protein CcmA (bactofilin family)
MINQARLGSQADHFHLSPSGGTTMADPTPQDVPTVLGPDSYFKGEISFDKAMRIHGRFDGKITSTGKVHVAKEAKLQAEVEAAGIVVEGQVQGRLVASERLELKQSARHEGDLRANRMIVEEGAVFTGHVSVGPDVVKAHAAPTVSRGSNGPLVAPPMPAALTR